MKQGLVWYLIVMLGLMPVLTSCSPSAPTSKEYIPHPFGRPISDQASSSSASVLPRLAATEKKARIQAKLLEIATQNTLPVDKRIMRIQVFIPTEERLQSFATQALPLKEITQVKASVSGIGIDAPIKPTGADANGFVPVPAEGVVILDFVVPVGPRIVTVEGYTSQGQLIGGSTLKAAFDVREVKVAPSALDFETTAAALVMEELLGVDAFFASRVEPLKLQEFVRNFQQLTGLPHPLFLNPSGLARILVDSNLNTYPGAPVKIPNLGAVPLSYQQDFHPGSVTIHVTTSNGNQFPEDVTVQIEDPVSEIAVIPKGSAAPAQVTIPNLYPGLWLVTARRADGTLFGANSLLFAQPDGTVTGLQQGTQTAPFVLDVKPPSPKLSDLQLEFKQFLESFNQNTNQIQLVPVDPLLTKIAHDLFELPAISASNTYGTLMNTTSSFLQEKGIIDGIANLAGAFLALKLKIGNDLVLSEDNSINHYSQVETVARIYRELFSQQGQFVVTDFTTEVAISASETNILIRSRPDFSTLSKINYAFEESYSNKEYNRLPELNPFRILQSASQLITSAGGHVWNGVHDYSFFTDSPGNPPQGVVANGPSKVKGDSGLILTTGGPLVVTKTNPASGGSAEVYEFFCDGAILTPIVQCLYNSSELPVPPDLTGTLYFGIKDKGSGFARSATDLFLVQDTDSGGQFCTASHACRCGGSHKVILQLGVTGAFAGVAAGGFILATRIHPAVNIGGIVITLFTLASSGYTGFNLGIILGNAYCHAGVKQVEPITQNKITLNQKDILDRNAKLPLSFVYVNENVNLVDVEFKIADESGNEIKVLKSYQVKEDSSYFTTLMWDFKDKLGNLVSKGTYEVIMSTGELSKQLSHYEIEIK